MESFIILAGDRINQQCYESLIFEAQKCTKKTLPIRVNFLLDEFSSLPQMKEFPSMIAAARSRNIRFNIVVQSEKQLRARYSEEADTIKGTSLRVYNGAV